MNIKRNKAIAKYLQQQLQRLGCDSSLLLFFETYVAPALSTQDSIEIMPKLVEDIKEDIFNNDAVLIETLKLIGIMEAAKDKKEFEALQNKRTQNTKSEKRELTDFDKILKAMMKVPNKRDEKK